MSDLVDDTQPRSYTRRELRAMDARFRESMKPPPPEVIAGLLAASERGELPVRHMAHDLVLLPGGTLTIAQVLAELSICAADYERTRHAPRTWQGPDSRISPPLDGPGYMDIPDNLDATTLAPAEYLAGVHLGWLQRPEAWMSQVKAIPTAHERFLSKVLKTA